METPPLLNGKIHEKFSIVLEPFPSFKKTILAQILRKICNTFHHNVRVWHFLVFVLMVDYGDAKSDNVSFHRALTNDPWQTIISPLGENLKIDKHFFAFGKVYSTTSLRLSLFHTAKRKYFISNIENTALKRSHRKALWCPRRGGLSIWRPLTPCKFKYQKDKK